MGNKLRFIKKIISVVVILFVVYILIGNLGAKNKLLYNIFKYNNFVVLSGSMEPTISAGDFVTIIKCDVNKLEPNDIITFYLGDEVVTHRIQSIDVDKIITKGDFNNISDNPIDKKDIIGKYIFRLPKFGYLISYLTSPSGIIIIIGIIIVLLFWDFSGKKFQGKKIIIVNEKEYREFLKYKSNIKIKNELSIEDVVKSKELCSATYIKRKDKRKNKRKGRNIFKKYKH